jgi:hypothetical protein
MAGKASKRRKRRRTAGIVNKYQEAQKIDSLLKEDKVKQPKIINNRFVTNAVHVYRDGRWTSVDASTEDFPLAIKMTITPEWAWDVVCNRNRKNRRPRQDRIDKYIKDIINDNWHVINNGIAFTKDGSLADGQHRLLAIADAQRPVEAFVIFGLEEKAIASIDEGASRAIHDVAQMLGITASAKQFAITNYILEINGAKRSTPKHESIKMFGRHKEAVDFVSGRLNKGGIAKAPVMAVCVRAYYNVDRAVLTRFIQILQDGVTKGEHEQPAVALRNWLFAHNKSSTGPARYETYCKTQYALVKFINETPVSRLYGLKDEQFPIPEDRLIEQLS